MESCFFFCSFSLWKCCACSCPLSQILTAQVQNVWWPHELLDWSDLHKKKKKCKKISRWRWWTHWCVTCCVNTEQLWGFIWMTQFVKCLMLFTDHELWTMAELKLKHTVLTKTGQSSLYTNTHIHTLFRDLSMHGHVHTHNVWWCWWSSGSQRMEEDDGWKVFDGCVGWLLAPLYFHSQPHPSVSHPLQVMSDGGRICLLSILLFPSTWGVSNSYNRPPLPTTATAATTATSM